MNMIYFIMLYFNPIIVLFLTRHICIADGCVIKFQSYYSLIFNAVVNPKLTAEEISILL